MIGQTVAHYKITAKLGSGGMGEVYLADDTKLDRKVALKFLPESLSSDPEARVRLIREAKAASKISHSNIVTIFAVENDDGRDFIAMEYIDGRSLNDYLAEKPRTLDEILRVAVQIGRALEHAHKAGIVHRDLKPGNIFIDREDRVRILDFGLARLPGADKLTKTGSTLGTISYMAPEQVEGKDADARSDIFSFGVLLYEMLTGQLPFSGEHHAAIMYSILNEKPRPLTDFRSDLPPAVIGIVEKALQKSPASRYAAAVDMTADLRRERDARVSGPSQVQIPVQKRKSHLVRVGIPVFAAVCAIILLIKLSPWSIDVAPIQEASADVDRLAVMYFDNIIDPDDPKRYGEIATNLLITDLSESQHMQIVSSQRLYDILKQLGQQGQKTVDRDVATQVANKARAKWMLVGTILQTEPRLVITSQIVETRSGNTVASQKVEGYQGESVFELTGRLAKEVSSDLSIPAPSDAGRTMTIEVTSSTEAYRHYLNGVDYRRQFYWTEAEREFRKALELDSTFAMAYFDLYRSGNGTAEEVEFWLSQAQRYSDRLGRRDRLFMESFVIARDKGWKAQIVLLKQIREEFPDDIEILMTLTSVLRNVNMDQEALAVVQDILKIDSTIGNVYNLLAYTYDDLGEFERSITAINKYIELSPNQANPYDSRADLYANHGKYEDAKTSYARAVEINPNFTASLVKLGLLNILTRDFAKAESCFQTLQGIDDPEARSRGRALMAQIDAHQGRFHRAIEVMDAAIEADRREQYTGWSYVYGLEDRLVFRHAVKDYTGEYAAARETFEATKALIPRAADWIIGYMATVQQNMGHPETADSLMAELFHVAAKVDTSVIEEYYFAQLWLNLHRHDTTHVRAYIDSLSARRSPNDHGFYANVTIAQGYLELSQPADAIPLIEDVLSRFSPEGTRDPYQLISLHYNLARAYEMSGWTRKAIERYEHFLSLWPDPDPELTMVDSAKVRIARLKEGA